MKKFIFLFISFSTFAQNEKPAKIISEIQIGNFSYYMIEEDQSKKIYKTVATEHNRFIYGETVEVNDVNSSDLLIPVKDLKNNQTIMSERIVDNSASINTGIPQDLLLRLPKEIDGIFYFQSQKHFLEVYDLTLNYIETTNDNSEKKMLKKIEKVFPNYNSFNKFFNNKYDFTNIGYTSDEVTKIEKEDFINDEIIKTFLNNDKLVVMGDSLYYYYDKDLILSMNFKSLNNEVKQNYITKLRTIESNKINLNLSLWEDRDVFLFDEQVVYLSNVYGKGKNKSTGYEGTPGESDRYNTHLNVTNVINCLPFRRAVVINTGTQEWIPPTTNANGIPVDGFYATEEAYDVSTTGATLKINWGDGSPIEIYNNYNYERRFHNYATIGDYTVTTTLIFETALGTELTLSDSYTFHVTGELCTENNEEEYGSNESGIWKLTAKNWVKHNAFGNHVGAYTHSWKLTGSGWKRKISHIFVEIDGNFRNDACIVSDNKNGDDDENQERVDKVKTKTFKKYSSVTGDEDIKSKHKLIKGSTTITYDLVLIIC